MAVKTAKTAKKNISRVKGSKVTYAFKPEKIREAMVTEIALRADRVRTLAKARQVHELIVKGESYETVSDKLGMTTVEAFNYEKELLKTWSGELCHSANEQKEIELKRIDAYTALVSKKAFPHQEIDFKTGKPMEYNDGSPVMSEPDLDAVRLLLVLSERRAKLLGIDAADKLKERVVDSMTRKYIGGDPDAL
jgi:hypothetical protein